MAGHPRRTRGTTKHSTIRQEWGDSKPRAPRLGILWGLFASCLFVSRWGAPPPLSPKGRGENKAQEKDRPARSVVQPVECAGPVAVPAGRPTWAGQLAQVTQNTSFEQRLRRRQRRSLPAPTIRGRHRRPSWPQRALPESWSLVRKSPGPPAARSGAGGKDPVGRQDQRLPEENRLGGLPAPWHDRRKKEPPRNAYLLVVAVDESQPGRLPPTALARPLVDTGEHQV